MSKSAERETPESFVGLLLRRFANGGTAASSREVPFGDFDANDVAGYVRGGLLPGRRAAFQRALLQDPNTGAVLVIHAPTATVDCNEAARGVIETVAEDGSGKAVLACWMGGETVVDARRALAEAGIATFDMPEDATRAFIHIIRYQRSQELLIETLYRIVIDKGLVTEEQFKDLVAQIDLEDGYEDEKIGGDRTRKAPKCSNCEKPINPKRSHCVYCNAEIPESARKRKRGSAYRR